MPRNGSGNYALPALNPVITDTDITSAWANTTMADLGAALTQSIAKDGQTAPTGNLPMAGNRHTACSPGANRDQYMTVSQAQDESVVWAGTAGGTANALTITIFPGISALAAGMRIKFLAAVANTAAVTVAVNALSPVALTKYGASALQAADLLAGRLYAMSYDGQRWVLQNPSTGEPTASDQLFYGSSAGALAAAALTLGGRVLTGVGAAVPRTLIDVQTFSSSGTWTRPAGCNAIFIYAQAPGGAGGGAPATSGGQVSTGSGGGEGGSVLEYVASGVGATETVTIGSVGAGGAGSDGGAGGSVSFGSHCSATGGSGGLTLGPASAAAVQRGGQGGAGSSGVMNFDAGAGFTATVFGSTVEMAGQGGGAAGARPPANNSAGTAGGNYGGGGSGARNDPSQAARPGGAGGPGRIIVISFT